MTSDKGKSSVRELISEVSKLTASVFEGRSDQRPLALDLDPSGVAARFKEELILEFKLIVDGIYFQRILGCGLNRDQHQNPR